MWVREGWETRIQRVFSMYCWLRIYRVVYKSVYIGMFKAAKVAYARRGKNEREGWALRLTYFVNDVYILCICYVIVYILYI